MVDLITATQCVKLLKSNQVVDWSLGYFSQRDKDGIFKHHHKPGSPKKFFKYDEVVEAIKENIDPRRNAQRDANKKKREDRQPDEDEGLLSMAGKYDSVSDLSEEEKAERLKLQNIAMQQKEEAKQAGIDDDSCFSDTDIEKMSVKDLNLLIMKQDLRIKTATADEKESKSVPIEKVTNDVFTSVRIFRDGLLGIPARLSSRIASISDPHECRIMIEKEIVRQLTNLEESFNEL